MGVLNGHVRVPGHVEDIAEVVLLTDEPIAEDVEVVARELDEVDDDGVGLLAGTHKEVSRYGGEYAGVGANASVSMSAGVSVLVVGFRNDGCTYMPLGSSVNVPNLSLVSRSSCSLGSLSI